MPDVIRLESQGNDHGYGGKRLRKILYLFAGGMALLSACSGNPLGPTATVTPNEVGTAVALGVQQTEESKAAEQTEAERPTAITDENMQATLTRAAEIEGYLRSGPETATAQVEKANPIMEQLLTDGYISSTNGVFRKLADYDRWNPFKEQFRRYDTNQSSVNFVLHAQVRMNTTEFKDSSVAGCGFTFRKTPNNTGNYVLIDFHGNLRYGVMEPDYWTEHGSIPNMVTNPRRNYEVWLVVEDGYYYVFVEGEVVLEQAAVDHPGRIWYLIAAGIQDINCSYEDVWVWTLSN